MVDDECLERKIKLYEQVKGILLRKAHYYLEIGDTVRLSGYLSRYYHIDRKLDDFYKLRGENLDHNKKS